MFHDGIPFGWRQVIFAELSEKQSRPIWRSLKRGFARRCPSCGEGHSFKGYLRIKDRCLSCQEPLGLIRADDFPPYCTIFVVGHVVVPFVLAVERAYAPPAWVHMAIWPAATLALTLALLPYIKGAVVGLMWALRLRGDEHQ